MGAPSTPTLASTARRGFDSPFSGGLRAFIPVAETFDFAEKLREATGGRAFPQCVFDHWSILEGDPYGSGGGGLVCDVLRKIRERKGLKPELPLAEEKKRKKKAEKLPPRANPPGDNPSSFF